MKYSTRKALSVAMALHGVDQIDLAHTTGLSSPSLSNLKAKSGSNPTVGTLVKIADALDIRLSELIAYGELHD